MRLFCLMLFTLWFVSGCSPPGVRHIVQPGQTLYRISKTYQVPAEKIIAYNHIKNPAQIRVGEALLIPGATSTRTVPVVPPAQRTLTVQKKSTRLPPKKTKKIVKSKPVVKKRTSSVAVKPRKGALNWPVRGKVVKSFGVKNNVRNKGIEIAIKVGSPVRCAGAGQVIYSGSGIKGYGHLVIIKHSHDLYTVYGYNQANLVKSGTYVSGGQKIALSGVVPSGDYGGLHFEVRQGNKAVNPAFYLP
ncbi:MAG: M23 family metallopeptidase [Desulfuromonas sp.]|nr:M23 family metallopeptidase [Desulfuromonas sp.]